MPARGRGFPVCLDDENAVEPFQHLCWRKSVEIFKDAIVGKDLHLVVRKDNAQENPAFPGTFARLENPCCGCASVMAVRNVKRRKARELPLEPLQVFSLGDGPGAVADPVYSDEINLRCRSSMSADDLIQVTGRPINQEDRPGLGIQRLDMPDA